VSALCKLRAIVKRREQDVSVYALLQSVIDKLAANSAGQPSEQYWERLARCEGALKTLKVRLRMQLKRVDNHEYIRSPTCSQGQIYIGLSS
jgi:hypothetical protein